MINRPSKTQKHLSVNKNVSKEGDNQTVEQKEYQTDSQTDKQLYRQTVVQTNSCTDKQLYRQTVSSDEENYNPIFGQTIVRKVNHTDR